MNLDLSTYPALVSLITMILGGSILIAGAHFLVTASVAMATRMKLSPFFIGATVVAFGTSVPELAASLYANLSGKSAIALGNVIGSNIANLGLVLGAVALFKPIPVKSRTLGSDLLLVILVGLVPLLALPFADRLSAGHGVLLLIILALYFWRLKSRTSHAPVETPNEPAPSMAIWLAILAVVGGCIMLVVGSQLFVEGAVVIGRGIGISEAVIGLTLVAFTTSLPELVTSVYAAIRGHQELGIGNILGSCIMNVLGILGIVLLFGPITVEPQVYRLDVPVLLVVSLACIPILLSGMRVVRLEGLMLLLLYLGYIATLFFFVPGWFGQAEAVG